MFNYLCMVGYWRLRNAAWRLFKCSCLTELDCNMVDLLCVSDLVVILCLFQLSTPLLK
jgi:hypothetical protein